MNKRYTCNEVTCLHNWSALSAAVVNKISKDLERNDKSVFPNFYTYAGKHSISKSKLPFNIWRFIQLVKLAVKP